MIVQQLLLLLSFWFCCLLMLFRMIRTLIPNLLLWFFFFHLPSLSYIYLLLNFNRLSCTRFCALWARVQCSHAYVARQKYIDEQIKYANKSGMNKNAYLVIKKKLVCGSVHKLTGTHLIYLTR